MTILVSNPRKPSSQSYAPHTAYCLLRNGPQFAQVGVFNRDGKLVSVSAIPVTVKVSVTEPSDVVTQEWLNRLRDVDLRLRASLRPQLFGWFGSQNKITGDIQRDSKR